MPPCARSLPLTCPSCGAALIAAPGDAPVTCSHCGSILLVRDDARLPGPAAALLDPREAAIRTEISALARELLALDPYQASAAVTSGCGVPLRTLHEWLDAGETGAPCRLITCLTTEGLERLREQYRGSPLLLSRRRRAGLRLIEQMMALRREMDALATPR